jgi:SAM-dependent methyltransferase
MSVGIPKSSQDLLGRLLSQWRNAVVAGAVRPPFLDLACGDNRLARSIDGGVGADILDHGQADLIVQGFDRLPFPSTSFRTITIVASLTYINDVRAVLGECSRILRPDGILVVTLLNPVISKIWHRFREPWASNPGFPPSRLADLCEAVGLRVSGRSRFMLGMNHLYVIGKVSEV